MGPRLREDDVIFKLVIPAQAGTQSMCWIPACAGMT